MVDVSVIVPTLNEADNIEPLLSRILQCNSHANFSMEVIIVDDGSTDGTPGLVQKWQQDHPVRLLSREGKRGLAGAILTGAKIARGNIVVVMDADLSHPPEAIPELARPIMAGTHDMVIGSRYMPGGSTPGWSPLRRAFSLLATFLAWPLADVRDPLSGFFAIHRKYLARVKEDLAGFKIGLELLVRGGESLRVTEIPIEFRNREHGKSKLGPRVILNYLHQLLALTAGNISLTNSGRFALVGFLGLVTDLSIFNLLLAYGISLGAAHIMSFFAATIVNYTMNARWSFVKSDGSHFPMSTHQYMAFLIVALLALFLRGGTLAVLIELWGWKAQGAILVAIGAAALVNYLGSTFFVFPQEGNGFHRDMWWRVLAIGIVMYMLALRMVYLGMPELAQEEAYYWNYAQHLDIGYLDHPPMVAWIIYLSTSALGNTEFAVRIGAFLCWLVVAIFSFRMTYNIFDKSTAFRALILIAVLPFFFGTGLIMTPDAPLVACWAGALYFLERALVGERRLAWWGAGVCLGLGMLSKYTIALLVPATLLFLLVDQRSRHGLLKPEPYAAVLVALLLFSPVIVWNVNHEWASLIFQGPRRWEGSLEFSLPDLMGQVLLWLTPAGILTVVLAILPKRTKREDRNRKLEVEGKRGRGWRFALIFSMVPMSVFFFFSLGREVKLNWTGPLWLAMIPLIASYMRAAWQRKKLDMLLQRSWLATIVTSMLLYGAFLHYLVLGIPGLPYPEDFSPLCWKALGQKIEQIEDEIEGRTGAEPLVVGMDKYTIASQLAFYRTRAGKPREQFEKEGVLHTTGPHLFGRDSLMYRYWFPEKERERSNMILVSKKLGDLKNAHLFFQIRNMGKIREIVIKKNGMPVGRYYYSLVGA